MTFTWRCRQCGAEVDIQRPANLYKDPPTPDEMTHPGCDGVHFRRVLTVPRSIRVLENEAQYFRDGNYRSD